MKRMVMALALLGALLIVAPAHAATWNESGLTSLRGSLAAGDGPWLELPRTIVWQFSGMLGGADLDPRAVERLGNGNTLITSRDGLGVYEIDPDGDVVWSYTQSDYPGLVPFHATRLGDGNTLIVSRTQDTVLEVDSAGSIVWQYGSPDDDTRLIDPFTAFRLPNGNTLIADNQACRVVEVTPEGVVAWQYGITGERASDNGFAAGYLDWPKWATRLANGNTLIADDEGHRVVEVTPEGSVAWSYGQAGIAGAGPGQLSNPVSAERRADGSTIIADSGNDRVIIVASDGTILGTIGTPGEDGLDDSGLADPRRVTTTPEGTLLIADTRNSRLIELGYAASGLVTSAQVDCGLPGARKRFTSISVGSDIPTGTAAAVQYSIDGGSWKSIGGTALPADTFGMFIQYRVTLSTESPASTPRLLGVSIGYEPAPTQANDDPGDGTGSPGTGGSGTGGTTSPGTRVPRSPRPSARTPGGGGSLPSTGGTMRAPEGYTSNGASAPEGGIEGPVSAQRGFALARVGTAVDTAAALTGTPAPLPSAEGLMLLGGLYAFGLISAPLGRVARTAISALPAD